MSVIKQLTLVSCLGLLITGCQDGTDTVTTNTTSTNTVTEKSVEIVDPTLADVPQKDNVWFTDAHDAIKKRLRIVPNTKRAKNVIVFVADGNGVGTNYATRLFIGQQAGNYGDEHVLPYETMPNIALVKTYNTNAQTPDSAGTATAMNTGIKTKAGVLGMSSAAARGAYDASNTVKSFAEMMSDAGKSVGVVSTARLTHATPAAVFAHSADRDWEDDTKLGESSNGQKDIAQQLFDAMESGVIDLAMGGGRRHFIPTTTTDDEGKSGKRGDSVDLIQKAKDDFGAQYAWDKSTFDALSLGAGSKPVLGLFESSHMQYEADRDGEPSLAEMTETAIRYLQNDTDGFYLMIESGRIDHANHKGNLHRTVTDGAAFSAAVAKAMAMTSEEDTLLIVTADHEHAIAFSGYAGRGSNILGLSYKINTSGTKHSTELNKGTDGKPYTIAGFLNGPGSMFSNEDGSANARPDLTQEAVLDKDYIQQALVPLSSETHSGEDVAVYARGPWSHLFNGTIEQNYIFHVMNYAVQIAPSTSEKLVAPSGIAGSVRTDSLAAIVPVK